MRNTKRCFSWLLALLMVAALLGVGVSAAGTATVSEVTLVMPAMQAGTLISADSIGVPDGAGYRVQVIAVQLKPFVGAPDALVTYPVGVTSQRLESGHVYAVEFQVTAEPGTTLGDAVKLNVQDTGASTGRNPITELRTDESGARSLTGELTYTVGSVRTPVSVTEMALTAAGSITPEVGQTLVRKLAVATTPANGAYKSEADVSWLTAAPGEAPTSASGTVQAGQAYYTISFNILSAEGYQFPNTMKLTLNGSALPASMLRMLSRAYSHVSTYAYTYYGIQVQAAEHGTASAPAYAAGTDTVQLTAQPDAGYDLAGWTVTDQQGYTVEVAADNTFVMPDPIPSASEALTLEPVSVTPIFAPHTHSWDAGVVTLQPTETTEGVRTYTCTVCGETRTEPIEKLTPPARVSSFEDVAEGQYYFDPVVWAVNHDPQITNGMSAKLFAPNATCTRGQVVTFLWRANGCPEPKTTTNPFTDVPSDQYYYKAVLWAVEKGITNGTSNTTFSPNDPCTRAHVVTFLWRSVGQPKTGGANPFTDVPTGQYYSDAVLWAVSRNITNGTTPTTFSPGNPCTRGQIVTFLYRAQ